MHFCNTPSPSSHLKVNRKSYSVRACRQVVADMDQTFYDRLCEMRSERPLEDDQLNSLLGDHMLKVRRFRKSVVIQRREERLQAGPLVTRARERENTRTHVCARTHMRTHGPLVTRASTRARQHTQTYARTHTHTHTQTCARTYAHTHTRTHASMHACTHAHMHTCTHARMHAYTHARMHTCTHACTQSRIHWRINMHMHAHRHAHTQRYVYSLHVHTIVRKHACAHIRKQGLAHAHHHHHHLPYSTGHFFSVLRTGLYASSPEPHECHGNGNGNGQANIECYISYPLTPSSSPLPPYAFPSPLISSR